jgi:predicted transcriptional regulator
MKSDSVKDKLLQDKKLATILQVLSETPSYIDELAIELNISKDEVKKCVEYLKKHKLIQEIEADNCRSSEIYPLILKKIQSVSSGLSQTETEKQFKNFKFLYISPIGRLYLPSVDGYSCDNKGSDENES